MRSWLIAACLAIFASGTAVAQMTGIALPTPADGATSPLGSVNGAPISPVGIGLGATELPSSGVSPAPTVTGSISVPATGTPCSTLAAAPGSMYGSTSTYASVTISGYGEITNPAMYMYKSTTNVSSSVLTGSMSVDDRTITLKSVSNLVGGNSYLLYLLFQDDGKDTWRYAEIICPKIGS